MIKLRIVKDIQSIDNELDRFLSHMLFTPVTQVCLTGPTWSPSMDVYETEREFVVKADLPGMDPTEIEVVVDRLHLKVSGCRTQCGPDAPHRVHQAEITHGRFERSFQLPLPIQADQVEAVCEDGLLTIHLPKEHASRSESAWV